MAIRVGLPWLTLCCIAVFSRADNLALVSAGACWPQELVGKPQHATTGDGSLGYAFLIERRIGLGVGVDFLWNTVHERQQEGTGAWRDTLVRQSFMFPLYVFLVVDPLSHLFIHPCLTGQIGYNSMVYNAGGLDSAGVFHDDTSASGYYLGLFARLSLDANYDFGERVGISAGVFYQWADTRSAHKVRDNTGEYYWRRDMSAVGIRGGLRFIF